MATAFLCFETLFLKNKIFIKIQAVRSLTGIGELKNFGEGYSRFFKNSNRFGESRE